MHPSTKLLRGAQKSREVRFYVHANPALPVLRWRNREKGFVLREGAYVRILYYQRGLGHAKASPPQIQPEDEESRELVKLSLPQVTANS